MDVCKKCGHTKPRSEMSSARRYQMCKKCFNVYVNKWRATPERRNITNVAQNKHYKQLRLEVLTHYGRGIPHCECCGETHIEFLTIDHINGGGNKHRLSGMRGRKLHFWLRREGYPSGYRVLCMNCNTSIGFHGYCPHQKEKAETDASALNAPEELIVTTRLGLPDA